MEVTPCFVRLRRMDDSLINRHLKKYGLVKVASGEFVERGEKHKESHPFRSRTISKKKNSRKRKREDRDDLPLKSRQRYSINEKIEDSQKYFSSSGTHKLHFNKKSKTYLENEKSSSCKLKQKKENYSKAGLPVVKILEEKKRSEEKKMGDKDMCSKQISQSKMKSIMEGLKKLSENKDGRGISEAFTRFSEQCLKNASKTFPIIHASCSNKSNDSNNNSMSGEMERSGKQSKGVDEGCSKFKQDMTRVCKIEKNDESYTVGRKCDPHLSGTLGNEALSLDEDKYDSGGDDSEDDKETVIFDEKFDTMEKLKECSEKVSECKEQSVKTNVKGRKLKSPRSLKRRKPCLVRIIRKGKMIGRKKLGKPTRKMKRKASQRHQIERRNKETIARNNKFVEKFEDILAEVSNLVKHLHDTHIIILRLKKDMEENEKLAEHFKTVIETQQENYRKEIWRNQETIMKGYDKMMSFCKKSSTVSLEISNRTFLSIEDVESVLSRCILVENALEMLKCTQKLSAVDTNVPKETENQGMSACLEKGWPIGTIATSDDSSKTYEKESHGQIIILNKCQDQLAPERSLRISSNLYPNDNITTSAQHLPFSGSVNSIPCTISTYAWKEGQVVPPSQGSGEHSEGLILHQSQSHESNHLLTPHQNFKRSGVNIINQGHGQDHQQNSTAMLGFLPENRIFDFIQNGKPRKEHIQPGNNVQNQLLIRQNRHYLNQEHTHKDSGQFLMSGSVQQILTTKRPPRPQNPIPRVFQPEMEMNSTRYKQQCQQQPGLMHRPSVQRRVNIEPNFAVPFNQVTSGSLSQSRFTYLPNSNSNMHGPYTTIRGISRPLSSINDVMSPSHSMFPQNVIPGYLTQFNSTTPNVSNMSSVSSNCPTSARTHTSEIPALPRQFQNFPSFSQNRNSCRVIGEAEPGLRVVPNLTHSSLPSLMRALHPVPKFSGSLNLGVAEQRYASKANERALRQNKSSDCIVPTPPAVHKSNSELQVFDPTIPQRLTMKNHRLQAGAVLISSEEVTKSKSQFDEDHMERVMKVESIDLQEEEKIPDTQPIVSRNPSRKYECAQNGCQNPGIRICKGCESVIYCSDTCQLIHWKRKHKEECTKLRELRR